MRFKFRQYLFWLIYKSLSNHTFTWSGEWGKTACMNGKPNIHKIPLITATTRRSQLYALPLTNLLSGESTIAALQLITKLTRYNISGNDVLQYFVILATSQNRNSSLVYLMFWSMKNNSERENPSPIAPNTSATRRDWKSTTSNVPLLCLVSEWVWFSDESIAVVPGIW